MQDLMEKASAVSNRGLIQMLTLSPLSSLPKWKRKKRRRSTEKSPRLRLKHSLAVDDDRSSQ